MSSMAAKLSQNLPGETLLKSLKCITYFLLLEWFVVITVFLVVSKLGHYLHQKLIYY